MPRRLEMALHGFIECRAERPFGNVPLDADRQATWLDVAVRDGDDHLGIARAAFRFHPDNLQRRVISREHLGGNAARFLDRQRHGSPLSSDDFRQSLHDERQRNTRRVEGACFPE